MNNRLMIPVVCFLCIGSMFFVGCEGDGGDDSQFTAQEGVAGSWSITLMWQGDPGTRTGSVSFQQDGNNLSGNMYIDASMQGNISGTVSGNAISFSGSAGFHGYNCFTGTISGSSMSGIASSTILPITDGTWTAYRR